MFSHSLLGVMLVRMSLGLVRNLFPADVKEQVSGTGISVISLLSPYLRASPMFLSLSALPSPHSSLRPRQVITATTLQQTTRNTETFCPTNLFQPKNRVFCDKIFIFIAYFHIMFTMFIAFHGYTKELKNLHTNIIFAWTQVGRKHFFKALCAMKVYFLD